MNLKKLLSAIGLLAVAAPATLSVVACGKQINPEQQETNTLIAKINELKNKVFIVNDEANARDQITDTITKFKKEDSKLTIDVSLFDYIDPNQKNKGSIKVEVTIKNEKKEQIANTKNILILDFSQQKKDQQEADALIKIIKETFKPGSNNHLEVPSPKPDDAETAIKNKINQLKEENNKDSNLELFYTFGKFSPPTGPGKIGLMSTSITIKDKTGEHEFGNIKMSIFVTLPKQ